MALSGRVLGRGSWRVRATVAVAAAAATVTLGLSTMPSAGAVPVKTTSPARASAPAKAPAPAPTPVAPAPPENGAGAGGVLAQLRGAASRPDSSGAVGAARTSGRAVVVGSLSDNSKTVLANPNGSFSELFIGPNGWHTEGSKRVLTDLSGVATGDATYPLAVPHAAQAARFGADTGHLFAWDLPGGTVTAAASAGSVSFGAQQTAGNQATYPGAGGHASLAVRPNRFGLESSMILNDPSAPDTFTVTLADPAHVLAGPGAATADGGWWIPRAAGPGGLTIPPAYAYPSGASPAGGLRATLAVTATVGGVAVTASVDPAVLAGAAYPVTLDPSFLYDTGEWGWTNDGPIPDCPISTANGGNAQLCYQNHDNDYTADGSYSVDRILIRPDLTIVPTNAHIDSATLSLYATAAGPYGRQLIDTCNSTGYGGQITGLTWNTTAGGWLGSSCDNEWSTGSGWQTWSWAATAQAYAARGPSANTGLVVHENCDFGACSEYTHFASGWDGAYGAPWPEAYITWDAPPAAPTAVGANPANASAVVSWTAAATN